jgi:membrane-bound lytic murein transglycosylase D
MPASRAEASGTAPAETAALASAAPPAAEATSVPGAPNAPGATKAADASTTAGAPSTPGATGALAATGTPGEHEYVVRPGDVLSAIARRTGTSESLLKEANGLKAAEFIYPGQRLKLGAAATAAAAAAVVAAATGVVQPAPPATLPVLTVAAPRPPKEPVSLRQADSTALLPAAAPTGTSDTTDYGVGADNTVIVQAAETLGHYADWSGVSSQALRTLNKLHKNAMVTLGHKVKLDFSRVTPAQFEATRREYHRHLQEEFFAGHRIAGTENYAVKRGDSLWVIAQQHADLPVWLVAQYNPDVDFTDVRPGTAITLPRVVPINRQ